MGLYAYDELVTHWKNERITTEQAIGQLLLHLGAVYERLRQMERRMNSIAPASSPQPDPPEERKRL